ncbi:ring-cleaving dioxygenase, partial [Bacillus cereus]|nr:ring-cleaving dioxygenase [Bacillus cereus]
MSQMILRPLSRNILRRPRVILQVSHESKKIKFKHTIRGVVNMKKEEHLSSHLYLIDDFDLKHIELTATYV